MGVNPSQERQAQRTAIQVSLEAEQRQQKGLPAIGTFEEVARRWFSVKKSQWMETYSSKVIRRLELHSFPQFGNLALSVITPKTVLAACRRVEDNDTLETAHRLREHCSSVFRFAIAEGEHSLHVFHYENGRFEPLDDPQVLRIKKMPLVPLKGL